MNRKTFLSRQLFSMLCEASSLRSKKGSHLSRGVWWYGTFFALLSPAFEIGRQSLVETLHVGVLPLFHRMTY